MNKTVYKKIISLTLYLILSLLISFFIIENPFNSLKMQENIDTTTQITMINGEKRSIRNFLNKPLLINFWAPFCLPCLQELDLLKDSYNQYKNRINFLGISTFSSMEEIKSAKLAYDITYPLAIAGSHIAEKWGARALPTTYLIAIDGTIIFSKIGVLNKEELEEALYKINK